MSTVIAYILLFTLIPVIAGISSALWFLIVIRLRKLGMHKYWTSVSTGVYTGIVAMCLGYLTFNLLGVYFGWIAGGILLLVAGRLGAYRLKNKEDIVLETGFMAGDVGSLWVGLWVVNSSNSLLLSIVMSVLTVGLVYWIYRKFIINGSMIFWFVVKRNPLAAKVYFSNSPDWAFLNKANHYDQKATYEEQGYTGPFPLPFDDDSLLLYYKGRDFEASQKEFVEGLGMLDE